MKKNYYVIMLVSAVLLSSCGTSKKLASSPQQPQQQPEYTQQQQQSRVTRVQEEIDECEKLSYEINDGKLRAYGSAIDADKDFARQIATVNARGQLVSDIKSLVTSVTRSYRSSTRAHCKIAFSQH